MATSDSGTIDIAKEHPHLPEMIVLVVGMPNVGKSTLLNALRNVGIAGRRVSSLLWIKVLVC